MASRPSRLTGSPARARLGPLLNTMIVAGGYMLSRVLGLGREVIISAQFGTRPEQDAWRLASDILNMMLVALLVACALIALLAEPLVAWTIGSGFDEQKRALTVHIL